MTIGQTILSVVCLTGSDQNKKTNEKRTKRVSLFCVVYTCVCVCVCSAVRQGKEQGVC